MRNGDRYIVTTPSLADKLDEYGAGTAIGKQYTFHVERHGRALTFQVVAVRDDANRWPSWDDLTTFIFGLSFVGIAAFLFVRVTTRVTWAVLVLSATLSTINAYSGIVAAYFTPYIVVIFVWFTATSAAYPWAAATFAVRFPNELPSRWGRLFERSMIVLGVLGGLDEIRAFLEKFHLFPLHLKVFGIALVLFPLLASAVVFLWRSARSRPDARQRFQWVMVGFAIYVAAIVVSGAAALGAPIPSRYLAILGLGQLALPASLAYAVLHQRVLDTRLVLGRAVVYGGVTFVLVLLFIGIDILSGKWLAGTGMTTEVQFAAAIGTGFALRFLHRRIEEAANRLFFRDRLAAQARLEEAATSLQHAESTAAIGEFLVDEPVEALHLASAALFVRAGTTFIRTHSLGWSESDAHEIGTGDALLARLHASGGALDLADLRRHRDDLPSGAAGPLLIEPVTSRGQIIAMCFYGGRTAGDALDGSELRALRRLAAAAAAAFDHAEANRLRLEVEELRRENARLLDLSPGSRPRMRASPPLTEAREER